MRTKRRHHRVLLRVAQLTVACVAMWRLALPQVPLAWAAARALAAAPFMPIAACALCAFVALIAYAQLLRVALGRDASPGLWHTFGIVTTTLGVSNALPLGSAVGNVVAFRMLERAGVPRSRAAVSMAVTSLGSAVILNVILGLSLIALLPTRGLASGVVVVLPVTATLIGVTVFVRSVVGHGPRLRGAAKSLGNRFPNRIGARPTRALDSLATQLGEWFTEPDRVRRAILWATMNWLIDAAALWIVLRAVGAAANPIVVLVAFAIANLAAMLPVTPGGLGVVELALVATLVGFGSPPAAAAVGVATYRLFNFWLPIPFSALTWVVTQAATSRRPPHTLPSVVLVESVEHDSRPGQVAVG